MRLRNRYVIVGVAWALLLAPAAAFAILGGILGALWLWLYGDNPWPPATEWVIPAIGLAVGISTAVCCIHVARRHGRQREIEAQHSDQQEWRRALLLALVPLAFIAILGIAYWKRSMDQAQEIAARAHQEAVFTELLDTRHVMVELAVRRTDDGDFEARVRTSGGRAGPYALDWQVNSMAHGSVLSGAGRQVQLGDAGGELKVKIPIDELARGYRDSILSGGGVLVDEPFELIVTLEPVIGDEETGSWPAFERHRLQAGDTPLHSSMSQPFPVRFRVGHDGTIDYPAP